MKRLHDLNTPHCRRATAYRATDGGTRYRCAHGFISRRLYAVLLVVGLIGSALLLIGCEQSPSYGSDIVTGRGKDAYAASVHAHMEREDRCRLLRAQRTEALEEATRHDALREGSAEARKAHALAALAATQAIAGECTSFGL